VNLVGSRGPGAGTSLVRWQSLPQASVPHSLFSVTPYSTIVHPQTYHQFANVFSNSSFESLMSLNSFKFQRRRLIESSGRLLNAVRDVWTDDRVISNYRLIHVHNTNIQFIEKGTARQRELVCGRSSLR
jgi:hypothetical protein